jgi:hypothetical protein
MNTNKYLCFSALFFALAAFPLKIMAQWEELCDGCQINVRLLSDEPSGEEPINLEDFNEDIARKIIDALKTPELIKIVTKIGNSFAEVEIRWHPSGDESPPIDWGVFIQNFHDKVQSSSSGSHSPDSLSEEDTRECPDTLPVAETPEEEGIPEGEGTEEDGIPAEDEIIPAWSEEAAYRQVTLEISREDIDAMSPLAARLVALKAGDASVISEELCNVPGHEGEKLVAFLVKLHEGFWTGPEGMIAVAALIQNFWKMEADPYEYFEYLNICTCDDDWQGSWGEIIDFCNRQCICSLEG